MGQWDKLIRKITSLNKDMRFLELKKVLESYGYVMSSPKSGSSHHTFRKPGCNPITIPNHEPINNPDASVGVVDLLSKKSKETRLR